MRNQTINVFISYSHVDAALVAPVVRLLRVNRSLVFQDSDRIPPGKRWRGEIAKALARSNLVIVFWCHHASRSNEVSNEWRAAIELAKDLLPLLLDSTPLPSELADFQWIDFRATVGTNHGPTRSTVEVPPLSPRPMRSSRWRRAWYAIAGVSVAAAAALTGHLLSPFGSKVEPGRPLPLPLPPPPPAAPPPRLGWVLAGLVLLLMLVVLGALGACFFWLRQRSMKRKSQSDAAEPHASVVEHRIAIELEAEILRRVASPHEGGA